MSESINLTSVYAGNIIGLILLAVLFMGNIWRIRKKNEENTYVINIIALTALSCIIDPIVFTIDGLPGTFALIVNYAGNAWLYFSNILVAYCWVSFICFRMFGSVHTVHKWIMRGFLFLAFAVLILNIFVPVAFSLENNVYVRGPIYTVFFIVAFSFMADSIIVYIISWFHGGVMKFFPVWLFLAPIIAGAIIQTCMYGLSILWACFAVAIAGILTSLQNETIYKDTLTGLYNREYLNYLQKRIVKKKHYEITGVMLDLNDFKGINDKYGHTEGDRALIIVSKVLERCTGSVGSVIRYAGDEFVIMLNTKDERFVRRMISRIRRWLESDCKELNLPYELTVSVGYCVLDLTNRTMNDFMNDIDHKMYSDKKRFYESHPKSDRRKQVDEDGKIE